MGKLISFSKHSESYEKLSCPVSLWVCIHGNNVSHLF